MEVCSAGEHKEIVWDGSGRGCPVCEILSEFDEKNRELIDAEKKIENLEEEIGDLQETVEKLEKGVPNP